MNANVAEAGRALLNDVVEIVSLDQILIQLRRRNPIQLIYPLSILLPPQQTPLPETHHNSHYDHPPIVELHSSAYASGKTPFLTYATFQTLIAYQSVIYIDNDGRFNTAALYHMLTSHLKKISSNLEQEEQEEQQHESIHTQAKSLLDYLVIIRPQSFAQLLACLALPAIKSFPLTAASGPVGLLIIDSLTAFTWENRAAAAESSSDGFATLISRIREVATFLGCTVLVSTLRQGIAHNQIATPTSILGAKGLVIEMTVDNTNKIPPSSSYFEAMKLCPPATAMAKKNRVIQFRVMGERGEWGFYLGVEGQVYEGEPEELWPPARFRTDVI